MKTFLVCEAVRDDHFNIGASADSLQRWFDPSLLIECRYYD
ncbi:hypothetical protein [Novipirellula aureliae]|nr:hypothetical protein [Novipirellula aureliae]